MSDGYQGTPGTGPGMPPPGGQASPPHQPQWQPTMPNPQAPVDPLWQPTAPGAAQPYPNQPPTQQVPTQPQWGAIPPPGQYPPGQYAPPPQPPAGRPRKQLLIGGGVAAALLAGGLAFGLTRGDDTTTAGTTTVATVVEQSTPSTEASATTEPAPSTTTAPLPADIDTIARSVVQLIAVDAAGDGIWTGSGTIISADGLILTNAHVVENSPDFPYDHMVVAITDTADTAPAPTYRGVVVAFDAALDLAVLQINADMNNNPVTVADLPFLPVGNSDSIGLGDSLRIFGYPGIGGDTITFTEGSVSGFTSEPGIPNRAWVKTDATIAGGNSGGTAVNDAGELVAVPTRASATDGDVADCRVVQDTNGDNVVDENDSCIPIGGFINGLRPTNLALPLIEQGKLGEVVQTAPPIISEVDTTGAFFSSPVFAPDVTANDEPTQLVQSLPSGATKLCAFFDWEDMPDGATWDAAWSVNGEFNAGYSLLAQVWNGGPFGSNWWVCINNADGPLDDGVYEVALFIGDEQRTSNSVFIGNQYAPTNVEVVNGTSTEVCYLRLSPAGAQNWGPDELDPTTTIPAGTSLPLTVIGAVYDVLATDCDDNVVVETYGVDLSGGGTLTLTP